MIAAAILLTLLVVLVLAFPWMSSDASPTASSASTSIEDALKQAMLDREFMDTELDFKTGKISQEEFDAFLEVHKTETPHSPAREQ